MICGISKSLVNSCWVVLVEDMKANESNVSEGGGMNVGGLIIIVGLTYVVGVVDFIVWELGVSLDFSTCVVKVDETEMDVVVTKVKFCAGGVGIHEVIDLMLEPKTVKFR